MGVSARILHVLADVKLQPPAAAFSASVTPPGSKSLSNRALVLAALADGVSDLDNMLFADDTLVMLDCLIRLGFKIEREEKRVRVYGKGGRIDRSSAELFCGNSGTTIRFLTALCALGHGKFNLDGIGRMRQRPIRELVNLLRNWAVRMEYVMQEGFPPVNVLADGLAGGIARFGASQSSQYLSAALQIAPYACHEVQIDLDGPQTSWPYVAMTMRLMDEFGVTPEVIRDPATGQPSRIICPRGKYHALQYAIEPDASNASYFLAAAAIRPGAKMTINGLGKKSLQADVGFADLLHRMGANLLFGAHFVTVFGTDHLEGIDSDMGGMPDMAQTLAVVALFAEGPTTMRGLHTLRVKETDRIAALASELTKLGATIDIEEDVMTISPPAKVRPAAIDTYDDHRMAMSFAVAASRVPDITIKDAQCVSKTYPNFFGDFEVAISQSASVK